MTIVPSLPFTLTNGQVADATQVMANFNQIVNSVNSNAAASGANSDITSLSALTTPITPGQGGTPFFVGGTTTGSANAQVIGTSLPDNFTLVQNYVVSFIAGYTNTGAMTLAFNSTSATPVYKGTHSGDVALVGGEVVAGNSYAAVFNGTEFVLLNRPIVAGIPWANAGGTAQAITGSYLPVNESLTDGLILGFRALAANTATAPTFAPDGLTAEAITKEGGVALLPGDIPNPLAEMIVRYNLANTRWELLNPAQIVQVPPAAAITGYLPSGITGTNTTGALTVSSGQATESLDTAFITKNTTTSWAVSNGNAINGYQGGTTLPNSSTIHFFICQGTSGTGVFASTSLSPTLPSGYNSIFRRIFSLNTSAAGALLPGTAVEIGGGAMRFYLATVVTDVSNSALGGGSAATLTTMTVPSGIKVEWFGRVYANNGTSNQLITSPDETDVAVPVAGTTNPGYDYISTSSALVGDIAVTTNTSGQIRCRSNSNAPQFYAYTRGNTDFRRT